MSVAFGKPDEPPRFDELRAYIQRIERVLPEREFRANPPAWTRPPFPQTDLTPYVSALDFHARFIAALDAVCPPTEPRDQESTMTTPTQRRHEEIVALLTEIRAALTGDKQPSPEPARTPEWDCASCGEPEPTWQHECPDPVGVTVEPPVGSQVTDRGGDVWQRFEDGWDWWWNGRLEWSDTGYHKWSELRSQLAPLRLTTDADRERVGLPVGLQIANEEVQTANDGSPRCKDVDPDEALARVIFGDAYGSHEGLRLAQLDVARAAREHLIGGQSDDR